MKQACTISVEEYLTSSWQEDRKMLYTICSIQNKMLKPTATHSLVKNKTKMDAHNLGELGGV